jgi:hypothetical protein
MKSAKLKDVHISQIAPGDTIEYEGKLTTVSANNIKRDSFMGITLFGDSYNLGSKPISKVVGWIGANGNIIPIR